MDYRVTKQTQHEILSLYQQMPMHIAYLDMKHVINHLTFYEHHAVYGE